MNINEHVALATAEESKQYLTDGWDDVPAHWRSGGRCGTLFSSIEVFSSRIGNPHGKIDCHNGRY